jgi:hypothetical protein
MDSKELLRKERIYVLPLIGGRDLPKWHQTACRSYPPPTVKTTKSTLMTAILALVATRGE